MKRWISSLAALCLAAALVAPIPAQGADQVSYLPGVTEEMTDRLLAKALERGAPDNVTIVLFRVE